MADDSPREGPGAGKPNDGRAHAGGFTLDLSAGKPPGKRRRKSNGALVQQTIDLSSKPAVPTPPPAESAAPPAAPAPRAGRERPRPAGGHSLADLLDPETLARLRGSE